MDHENEKETRPPSFARNFTSRERDLWQQGKGASNVAKVGTRLVAPFKGIQLYSACECLLNPIN